MDISPRPSKPAIAARGKLTFAETGAFLRQLSSVKKAKYTFLQECDASGGVLPKAVPGTR